MPDKELFPLKPVLRLAGADANPGVRKERDVPEQALADLLYGVVAALSLDPSPEITV
jgi:hypothetical protein